MNNTQQLAEALSTISEMPKVMEDVLVRLEQLESISSHQTTRPEDNWVTLEKAAPQLENLSLHSCSKLKILTDPYLKIGYGNSTSKEGRFTST